MGGTSAGSTPAPGISWDAAAGSRVGRVVLRVRYAETDRMGIAYNAHYLTWFEIGRTEFLRSLGTPYREVEERGYELPLVEAALRLRRPVAYDDEITVETRVDEIRSRTVRFAYRILSSGAMVADGSTLHACKPASEARSVTLPGWLRERVAEAFQAP